jgi:hypothetical protein
MTADSQPLTECVRGHHLARDPLTGAGRQPLRPSRGHVPAVPPRAALHWTARAAVARKTPSSPTVRGMLVSSTGMVNRTTAMASYHWYTNRGGSLLPALLVSSSACGPDHPSLRHSLALQVARPRIPH